MTTKPQATDFKVYKRLVLEARPYLPLIGGIFFLNLVSIPLTLLIPLPLKIVVDHVLAENPIPSWMDTLLMGNDISSTEILFGAVVLVVGLALLRQIQELASRLLLSYAGNRLVLDFRAKLFRHVQRLSLKHHDTHGFSDSSYRIQYDASAIQHIAVDGIIPYITSIITLLAMVTVTAQIDWTLALVAITVAPVFYFLLQVYRRPLRRRYHKLKDHESIALAVIHEVLSAVRVVKAFGREDYEHQRYLHKAGEGLKARLRVETFQGIYDLLIGLITALGTAAVLYLGVRHVQQGQITLGQLLLVMAYLAQLYAPLRTMSGKAADIQASFASAERAFALLDSEPDVIERANALPLQRATGQISFRDLTFGYHESHKVLDHVSFDVPAGSRIGIAGHTGAGKTTLISLLTRFYDPISGAILIDGVDIRDYKLADLRNQFAIMLQEPVLFSTTINENIAYAKPGASEQDIIEAAKAANAHDFITQLPEGYETKVGERGMKLSGGERQRISLARAFLKNAPILILDEPTSSVDMKTESMIMDAMNRLMQGRTTFMIAHRLSTLDYCNLRINLDHGRLIPTPLSASGPSQTTPFFETLPAAVRKDLAQ